MEDMNELALMCFEIIGRVGSAKSSYVKSIQVAREGDFDGAQAFMAEGDAAFAGGHDVHLKLLQADAAGERGSEAPLILLHAEDQMASAETVKIMATEFIALYKRLGV